MGSTTVTVRMSEELARKLKRVSEKRGLKPSAYAAKLIEDGLSDEQRIDLIVKNIMVEVLQLEDMLSLMMSTNKKVFATMLGRTEPSYNTKEERLLATSRRDRAMAAIEHYIRQSTEEIIEGENVWGSLEIDDGEGLLEEMEDYKSYKRTFVELFDVHPSAKTRCKYILKRIKSY